MKKKILLSAFFAVIISLSATAQQYDFQSGAYFYKIIDASAKTVSVVPELATIRMVHGSQDNQAYYSDKAYDAIYDATYVVNGNTFVLNISDKVTNAGTEYTVTELGKNAFFGLKFLITVNMPNTVSVIGEYAFGECNYVKSYTFPNALKTIGPMAFYRNSTITSIEIPNTVTAIKQSAFHQCGNLTSVKLPDSLTELGGGAFFDCTKLASINLPPALKEITATCFMQCSKITSVVIPNSATKIGQYAFKSCYGLTTVVIGSGVTAIDAEAFYMDMAITSITCLATTPPTLGSNAFLGVPQKISAQRVSSQSNAPQAAATLYVPSGSVDAYKAATGWKNFVNIVGVSTGLVSLEDIGIRVRTTKGMLHISGIKLNETANNEILIYNVSGKMIHKQKADNTDINISIPISGAYLIRINNAVQKVVLM